MIGPSDKTGGGDGLAREGADAKALAWLRREAGSMRGPLRRTAAFTVLAAVATVAQAWFLAVLLAGFVFPRPVAHPPWVHLAEFLLAALVRACAVMAARHTSGQASLTALSALRMRLVHRIQALDPLTLRAHASGDAMTRLVDGVEACGPYLARYVPQASAAAIMPLVLGLWIFRADWIAGLVLAFSAPLIPVFMVLVGQSAERAAHERFAQLRRLGSTFIEALSNLTALRALGAAERVADSLDADGETYRRLTLEVLRVAFLSSLVLEFFTTVSIAVVAVLIGFRLLAHALPFRDGLFVLLLAPEFYLPLRALGSLRHARLEAVAAAASLRVIDQEAETRRPEGGRAAPKGAPALALQDVTFVRDGQAILRKCSCRIRPGQVTALVGATGAGKSTILQLLCGFARPQEGRITVDGVDLSLFDGAQWRGCIAWIPQQPYVFAGSARHNLLLAGPVAEGVLAQALADSGFDQVVARWPAGLDTELGEHGVGLSGGELQRLGLARAWLRQEATVWLFDEATAHLDDAAARQVEARVRQGAQDRTVLLVAHRMQVAEQADWVIVLDSGAVIEEGPPRDLARRGGAYRALLEAERV